MCNKAPKIISIRTFTAIRGTRMHISDASQDMTKAESLKRSSSFLHLLDQLARMHAKSVVRFVGRYFSVISTVKLRSASIPHAHRNRIPGILLSYPFERPARYPKLISCVRLWRTIGFPDCGPACRNFIAISRGISHAQRLI